MSSATLDYQSNFLPDNFSSEIPEGTLGSPKASNSRGYYFTGVTGDNNIDGLISGGVWYDPDSLTPWHTEISYSFPQNSFDFQSHMSLDDIAARNNLVSFGNLQQTAMREVFDGFEAIAQITFTKVNSNEQANIVIAGTTNSAVTPTASSELPAGNDVNQWYNANIYDHAPQIGSYTWHTLIHETGHSLGLAHGHEVDRDSPPDEPIPGKAMDPNRDSMEFSIMTYRSYINDPLDGGYSNEDYGYAQSLMMYDIAAIQEMYGANYETNSGDTTYTFSSITGEMFVNGVGQGTPGDNRIFRTIWDGNGEDTYDFSNYNTGINVDLSPGSWSLFSENQQAYLGDGNYARANVFNALLYEGDSRSLIENAVGGDGNDTIIGNIANNRLNGGVGNDTLNGGDGNDTLIGGDGNDVLRGGTGADAYSAGNGNDTIYYANGDKFWNSKGNGINVAGAGVDTLIIESGSYFDTNGLSWYGFERFVGAEMNDRVKGNSNKIHYHLDGGAGNDTLTGAGGNDTLIGGDGNDVLRGGTGADAYSAGNGNDTIYYANGDKFWNSKGNGINVAGAGVDTLIIESGSYFDTNGLSWYGFERFVGAEMNDRVKGNSNKINYHLDGGAGNDTLTGAGGNDTLNGGDGNDTLIGGDGNDILNGGEGNDTYFVDNAGDTIIEADNSGIDTIISGVSFKLTDNIEDLTLTGTADNYAIGNSEDNTIIGNDGDNHIEGGAGTDILTGGAGSDLFNFREGMGNDIITDFEVGIDKINIPAGPPPDYPDFVITDVGDGTLVEYNGDSFLLKGIDAALIAPNAFSWDWELPY
ncbi:serralysin [Pseudovibrio denitrificans]|uniref:Serralysin n=3 Tax=Pseudovibrio denitrificans TaxID=258256 RepID=A0A1I6ZCQ0_9HYPH|nr:M10 family metallopeptidase [Pseudovibrio denitrificans]SFT60454.1 serralysin [Pseudovibrio denitrificans]